MTRLLAVNAGSSSLKAAVFEAVDGAVDGTADGTADGTVDGAVEAADRPHRVLSASIPRLDVPELVVRTDGIAGTARVPVEGPPLDAIMAVVEEQVGAPDVVVHRFVHGGPTLTGATRLDAHVLATLRALTSWAPLHQPAALVGVERSGARWPDAVQVGCFDTAFHATLPEAAARLPLPDWTWRAGVRRYGFHGLALQHVVDTLGAARLGRAVLAHLGNGTSLTAVADGRSIDTTMGFTPDGGVVMGSRSGDLDPGVLLHLLDDGLSVADLRSAVEEHGGLRALSGGTADMQTLLAHRSSGDARAALAVEVYTRRIRMQIGAYAALLGGLDTLVFTGGIGEHAAAVRSEICADLGLLGVEVDADRNVAGASSVGVGPVEVLVLGADEEQVMARQAFALVGAGR